MHGGRGGGGHKTRIGADFLGVSSQPLCGCFHYPVLSRLHQELKAARGLIETDDIALLIWRKKMRSSGMRVMFRAHLCITSDHRVRVVCC